MREWVTARARFDAGQLYRWMAVFGGLPGLIGLYHDEQVNTMGGPGALMQEFDAPGMQGGKTGHCMNKYGII